ncbi:DNA-processing protein DprA [Pseudomonas sp.]|uniref:DNA-processing protein DprA n=1 Tax=Pseudomonas sp. TaxID=306 RepID=UPI0040538E5D
MDDKEFWKNERVAFLALSSVKGVGFWTLHKITDAEGSFKDALKDPEPYGLEKCLIAAGYVGVPGQELLWSEGLGLARTLAQQGIRLLFRREPGFPQKLKEIPDAPEWIFVQGAIENLSSPAVTVVGTRKPSDDGLFLTRYALACLAELRCVTVSGLALGIDQL